MIVYFNHTEATQVNEILLIVLNKEMKSQERRLL